MRIVSRPFQLTYWELMRTATIEYLRRFWWYVVVYPAFGLLLIVFGPNDFMRGVGVLGLLWPLTLPLRARMPLWRAMRVRQPLQVGIEGDSLLLMAGGRESRRPISSIRRAVESGEYICLYTGPVDFMIVPRLSFQSPDEARQFLERLRSD